LEALKRDIYSPRSSERKKFTS